MADPTIWRKKYVYKMQIARNVSKVYSGYKKVIDETTSM